MRGPLRSTLRRFGSDVAILALAAAVLLIVHDWKLMAMVPIVIAFVAVVGGRQ